MQQQISEIGANPCSAQELSSNVSSCCVGVSGLQSLKALLNHLVNSLLLAEFTKEEKDGIAFTVLLGR